MTMNSLISAIKQVISPMRIRTALSGKNPQTALQGLNTAGINLIQEVKSGEIKKGVLLTVTPISINYSEELCFRFFLFP